MDRERKITRQRGSGRPTATLNRRGRFQSVTMGSIEEIYADLEADLSEEEFREAVADKVAQMGGLADEETAAMLLAHELDDGEVHAVADIKPGQEEVKFTAKVTSIGELRTFERDDGQDGQVINVEVADESGSVRVAFWDDRAVAAEEDLEVGQVLKLGGRPTDGYQGVEVNVDRVQVDEETDIEVSGAATTIEDLALGQSDVNLRGQVLDTEAPRTFERDDGSEGKVGNLVLGDETGRVRVTLWDDRADRATELDQGTAIEVVNGYVRERDGQLELHVGSRGAVESIDDDIEYVPDTTPITELELDQTADIAGVVRSTDPVRTFDRDDGTEGQVKNIHIQDKTGDIRVALWGEKAERDIQPGDEVLVADGEVQEGWQSDLEVSAGWRSTVSVLDTSSDGVAPDSAEPSAAGEDTESQRLDAFAEGGDRTVSTDDREAAGTADERIEFTGVVVQAGDPVLLDDGEETLSVRTGEDVHLGQEVRVRGRLSEGTLEADELYPVGS